MAYLQAEWDARGITQTAFARENRLDNSMFSRWRTGAVPKDIELLRVIADGLGKPLLEILVAARLVRPDEAGVEAQPAAAPDVDVAIELDARLNDAERDLLRAARLIGRTQRDALEAALRRPRKRISATAK
jgi:transcriptional regulator with XRE-family HTH domain